MRFSKPKCSSSWLHGFLYLALAFCVISQTTLSPAKADDAWQSMFDGTTLENWSGNPDFWSVQDGAITGQTTKDKPTKGNTFIIWQGGTPGDFEMKFKFRIDGGNSGVQYRSREVSKWVMSGYQADFDAANGWTGSLYEERGRGVLAKRGKKVTVNAKGKPEVTGETTAEARILESIQTDGGWNTYRIVARGNHLQQYVNGMLTVDVTDNDTEGRAATGQIALQVHQGPPMKVQFKDLKIKKLTTEPSTTTSDDSAATSDDGAKKIVFIAGNPSHGRGQHEHHAGCLLLAKHLQQIKPEYQIDVHRNGWPADPDMAFQDADCVVIFCDGGPRHVVIPHEKQFDAVMDRGTGLVCIHYGVEVPKGPSGDAMLQWLGGYFETNWSVNPHWKARFDTFPEHPITRGVEPFEAQDEWYFHMRFRDNMQGVTPILSAVAPEETMSRRDGPHSGNPHVRRAVAAGEPQHVAWASEREGGGRGFGFTGAHFHSNWANDSFRRIVLNAIIWSAHGTVPDDGAVTNTPDKDEIEANLD